MATEPRELEDDGYLSAVKQADALRTDSLRWLRQNAVKLKTPDGRDNASVDVNTDNPFHGAVSEQSVPFVVPPGYKRFSFHGDTKENRGTAWVRWSNDDEHNGTITIHADCRPLGSAHAAVSEVYAIPECDGRD